MANLSGKEFFGGGKISVIKPANSTSFSTVPSDRNYISNTISDIKDTVTSAGENLSQTIKGEGQYANENPIVRGFKGAETLLTSPISVASKVIPRSVRDYAGKAFERSVGGLPKAIGEDFLSGQPVQNFVENYPEATGAISDIAKIGQSSGNIASSILMENAGAQGLNRLADKITKPFTTTDPNVQLIKDRISNSQAADVQRSIQNGDIPRNFVYAEGNKLNKLFAQGRIDDIAQKLDMFKPGLGNEFRGMVDPSNVTMSGNVPEGLVKLAHNLVDKSQMPTIPGTTGILAKPLSKIDTSIETPNKFSSITNNLGDRVSKLFGEGKNINPQIKASAERLKETYKTDPVSSYDEFYNQEQKFKNDIKADTALGIVGERTGNAFEKVINQRRDVGKLMEQERSKIGNENVTLHDTFTKFQDNLNNEGIVYNPKTKTFDSTKNQTKLTNEDNSILLGYKNELNKLGLNPTVNDIDSFISRISRELDLYKDKNNIKGTTNAERIVKSNLSDIRNELSPEVNGKESFRAYYEARKAYSELSDFIDEGASFLGKKTQAGDFSKDTSLTKSAIQSILNGGKKDWLIKLEDLTKYPALDEGILAIQAMKDSGNFRADSLLESLTSGGVPKSPSGLTDRIANWLFSKGVEAAKGSSYEQTKRFLQDIKNNIQSLIKTNTAYASTGDSFEAVKENMPASAYGFAGASAGTDTADTFAPSSLEDGPFSSYFPGRRDTLTSGQLSNFGQIDPSGTAGSGFLKTPRTDSTTLIPPRNIKPQDIEEVDNQGSVPTGNPKNPKERIITLTTKGSSPKQIVHSSDTKITPNQISSLSDAEKASLYTSVVGPYYKQQQAQYNRKFLPLPSPDESIWVDDSVLDDLRRSYLKKRVGGSTDLLPRLRDKEGSYVSARDSAI